MKRRFFGAALVAGLLGLTSAEAMARGRSGGRSTGRRASFSGGGGGGGSRGGCGSRGGPGYRKADGKCASHKD